MQSYKSIFDNQDTSKNQKIWAKMLPGFSKFKTEQPNFEIKASKPSSKGKKMIEERCFSIKKNYLYYRVKDSSNQIRGVCDLRFITARFLKIKEKDLKVEFKFLLMLVRNMKYSRIFLRNESEVRLWRQHLAPYCVFNDFTEKYEVIGGIGYGSYGKVIFQF